MISLVTIVVLVVLAVWL